MSIFRKYVGENGSFIKPERITGISHEDQYTFMNISCLVLLGMRNISDKSCRENQNTLFMFSNLFSPENRTVYEVVWKSIVELDRPQVT
jgi:hypothetical protein